MEILLDAIIQYVGEIVGLLVISAIGIFGTWLLNKMNKNQALKNINVATEQVLVAAQKTVMELQQTYVNGWKAAQNGKLTEAQIEELKEKTLDITLCKLSQPTLALLEAAKIDIVTLIRSSAEAFILDMRKEEKGA
jgi:hypothetical protein